MSEIIYNRISSDYNSTRSADPYLLSRLIHNLNPITGKKYLDVGCGTGNYTIALAERGFDFTGVEPSDKMLMEAKARNHKVRWIKGTAEQIPLDDHSFDGAIATLTIHNWPDLKKAFLEIKRVFTNNARIVIFTSTPQQMQGYWLNHYFPEMMRDSIKQMPAFDKIEEAAEFSGLKLVDTEKYFVRDDLQDYFLYAGKNRPEIYFEERIRRGISSFLAFSKIDEVTKGLDELKSDLDNKIFPSIKNKYDNDKGDYLFVILEKT